MRLARRPRTRRASASCRTSRSRCVGSRGGSTCLTAPPQPILAPQDIVSCSEYSQISVWTFLILISPFACTDAREVCLHACSSVSPLTTCRLPVPDGLTPSLPLAPTHSRRASTLRTLASSRRAFGRCIATQYPHTPHTVLPVRRPGRPVPARRGLWTLALHKLPLHR